MPAVLRRAAPAPTDVVSPQQFIGSLSRPGADRPGDAPFDLWQRYVTAIRFLDKLCRGVTGPVRLLDLGCNVVNLLTELCDPARAHVTRCDVLPELDGGANYVRIDPDAPLPFDDGSFDAVIALEVLEHVPSEKRFQLLAELVRVAKRGVVVCCPIDSNAVREAERIASAAYELRHGVPHPFLREHAEFGVPAEAHVRELLTKLDAPFAVFDGASVDQWLAATLASEALLEGGDTKFQRELSDALNDQSNGVTECYRKFFVIAKHFDASDALELLPPSPGTPGEGVRAELALNQIALTSAKLLRDQHTQSRHESAALREVIKEQQRGLDAQELRFQVLRAYADGLAMSSGWRLLAPLRWFKRLLRPRGFALEHLLPYKELAPLHNEPGGWQSLGTDPHFLVSCYLPAGWVRVRLKATVQQPARIEFYAERDGSFDSSCLLGQFRLAVGANDEEFFLRLDRPTRALRIDPLDAPGEIRLSQLEVVPRPGPLAIIDALRRKLRLLRAYHNTGPVLKQGLKLLFSGRWAEVAKKWSLGLHDERCTRHGFYEPDKAYERWITQHTLTDADRDDHREWAAQLETPPVISVLLPTYNTPERYLRLAIESVVRQTYPHWELCIVDDGSSDANVRAILSEYASRDPRIKLAPPGRHGGISAATNVALGMATGDFVALFDHDDELAEHALYKIAKAAVDEPAADMIYSDEDKLQPDGKRVCPFFKPDWSPEFFLGCMYTCHLGAYRTSIVKSIGGFRPQFDGAQDYDLALRVIEHARKIVHVPDVLYHWRLLPNSTASGVAAKPEAQAAALAALDDHVRRTGRDGRAVVGPSAGLNFVRFAIRGKPKISIIVPTLGRADLLAGRPTGHLENCLRSVERVSTYKNWEVILLDRGTITPDLTRRLMRGPVRRVTYADAFNWSRVNNLGATHATGDYLLFLNDDVEIVSPEWLEALLEFAQHPEIGAVGAKLLFPDGALQHAGVTILDGKPGHPYYGYPRTHTGHFCRTVLPHNCAAVTGACLMTRRDVFAQAGGFDESFPLNYNDVDYCLRLRELGYRVVYTPHAELLHFESASKPGVFAEELAAFQARWGEHAGDPYYNVNLNTETFDYRIG